MSNAVVQFVDRDPQHLDRRVNQRRNRAGDDPATRL
jgi:hypothetical protein